MQYFRNGTQLLIAVACTMCMTIAANADTFFVDGANGNDGNDGSQWNLAFKTLQIAISEAENNADPQDQIWVKGSPSGIAYYPDEGPGVTNGDRAAAFELQENVRIYGGFAGTETDEDQRDPATNITILSGDIDQDGLLDNENSYSVVKAGPGLTQFTVLDGFTITAGNNTLNSSDPNVHGGGIRIDGAQQGSSPRIANCIIAGNRSSNRAGGIYIETGSPIITKCEIADNTAISGAGIAVFDNGSFPGDAEPYFVNCTIRDNGDGSTGNGGGFGTAGTTTLHLHNCVFFGIRHPLALPVSTVNCRLSLQLSVVSVQL